MNYTLVSNELKWLKCLGSKFEVLELSSSNQNDNLKAVLKFATRTSEKSKLTYSISSKRYIVPQNDSLVSSFLRTPLNKGARGRGAGGSQAGRGGGVGRGGRGGGVKREREPANQVANQSQVDIIDPNHVKNEADQENNEVEVTYESHPRTKEAIEAAEAMTKLTVMKQKMRKLEMEERKLQEEKQDLDAQIEEAREQVLAKI